MTLATALTYGLLFVSLYLEVFMLVAFLQRRSASPLRTAPSLLPDANLPTVAIVIPCYNEERTVAGTLRSLLSLRYATGKLEFIVVDDGSTDGTLAAAEAFTGDARVRVFSKANGGKHTAMNYALAHTRAELIGCLDADSVVASDALLRIVPLFAETGIAAVTPGIHVKKPETMLQHMQHVEYRLSIFNRFMLAALGSVFITPGPFSIFRASVVRELGGWRHGHSTEDMEMALRMQEAGHLIANAPLAQVHTSTPRTLKQLFRQRVRWTYGWLRNAVDYRHMLGNRAYGNLGLVILPSAIFSIGAGIFFFTRIALNSASSVYREALKVYFTGMLPHPAFDVFYFNTSMMTFLVFASVGLILLLISMGSFIGTGRRTPPLATPLFLAFYAFLVPLWLGTAVVRAAFKTGVRWR